MSICVDVIASVLRENRYVQTFAVDVAPGGGHVSIKATFDPRKMRIEHPAYPALKARRLQRWARVFDAFGQNEVQNEESPFASWNSSYTGRPLPAEEMQVWLNSTISRIAALNAKSVLEIGCGSGLLLERLAPTCREYVGIDSSPLSIKSAESRLRTFLQENSHVHLHACAAEELPRLGLGTFDLIVLNSVVQYFPDADYLRSLLAALRTMLNERGSIFLGDVRHLGLLRAFRAGIAKANGPGEITVGEFRRKLDRSVEEERELLLDPRFFHTLSGQHGQFSRVMVSLKRGLCDNELTKYRYDVVLCTDEHPIRDRIVDEIHRGFDRDAIAASLKCAEPHAVAVRDIGNARVALEVSELARIASSEAKDICNQVIGSTQVPVAQHPEALHQLGASFGYDVRIDWSTCNRVDRMDAIFSNAGPAYATVQHIEPPTSAITENEPLAADMRVQLEKELRLAIEPTDFRLEFELRPCGTA